MTFGDFDRLGLVPNLPPRAELPTALRLALAMTSLLPLELVAWVATAPADELRTAMRRAARKRTASANGRAAEEAGQLVRLIDLRLDRLAESAPALDTSLLPADLVAWVAAAPLDAVQTQMRQAVMVRFESEDEKEAEQAGQLARLCRHRIEQVPVVVPVQREQLALSLGAGTRGNTSVPRRAGRKRPRPTQHPCGLQLKAF